MDDRPVDEHRLEVIDSGSGERLYSAMRDQAERGRDFRRRVRTMWLRRDLVEASSASVIDLRDESQLSSNEEPLEPRQADSA